VNGPKWVAVLFVSFGGDNDMALAHVNDIVAEGLGHRVQRQGAIDKPLDKFETAYRPLLVLVDEAYTFCMVRLHHEFLRKMGASHLGARESTPFLALKFSGLTRVEEAI